MANVRTLAYFLNIQLRNDTTIGFSDLNYDIEFGGVTYYAKDATEPTASSQNLGLEIDNVKLKVLLDSTILTEKLIRSGLMIDAPVRVFLADFTNPLVGQITILHGFIGEATITNGYLEIEVNSTTQRLNKSLSRVVSPVCSFEFGGAECGIDLVAQGLQYDNLTILLVDVTPLRTTLTLNAPLADTQAFLGGFIDITSGLNKGIKAGIIDIDPTGQLIAIDTTLFIPLNIGDTVTVKAACGKTRDACSRYQNLRRFGGVFVGGNWVRGIDGLIFASER